MTRFDLRSSVSTTTLVFCLVICVGCGQSDWGYVTGVVTLDNQPVGPGTLVFEPADPERRNAPSSLGYFDESGQYELLSVGEKHGALVGNYHVIVMEGGPASLHEESAAASKNGTKIPPRYGGYEAGLTAMVETGEQRIDFQLTSSVVTAKDKTQ